MNKKFLKHYMETNPEGTAQTYIFLVDNQDIALNIVMSGYQALCLVQEDDGYYFSADSWFTIGILGLLFTRVTIYRDLKCDISELNYDF